MDAFDRDVFDLVVVGAGPAGAACALAAARAGLTVALFEARRTSCDKPCGEGLMPDGVDALRELGLDDVIADGRPFSALRYVLAGAAPHELPLPRPGLAIDRPRLMHGLESALRGAPGVTRFFGRVEIERVRQGRRTIGFLVASPAVILRARVLIAADGLNGKSAAWLRTGTPPCASSDRRGRGSRLGVRARYEARRPLDAVEIHFGRGTEIYLTPLPGNRINLAVLDGGSEPVSGGCESILARALAEHPHAASRLARRVTDPEARVLACRIPPLVAHEATFLVGDAGGGIDPILGCGVTLALESGILAAVAAQAIVRGDTSGEPERNYAKEYRRRTRMRRALAAFLLTLSKHPRLARGTFGLARLFPESFGALVNVAAGDGRNRLPARTKRHASDRDSHSGIEPYRAASTIKST